MFYSKIFSGISLLALALPALSVTVRINQLGDSITGSPGCWRALLWQKLQAAGITNTDFVGTLAGQGCGFTYDGENDGHGGFLATGIVRDNQLPGWLAVSKPDIVTMMLGTNDAWSHLGTTAILQAYTTLVGQMRVQNPKMVILVGQITPLNPSGCTDCDAQVVDLDAAIPGWAAGISTAQSPVSVVDLYTGFNTATDTGDGVHPNDNGNAKIAAKWFAPLSAAIKSFGGSSTTLITSTAKPTTSTTKPTSTSATSKSTTATKTTTAPTSSSTACAVGTVPVYAQCGGIGYAGESVCQGCAKCVYSNDWYSQCLP